jgi:DNA-directed RNA polymerase subunit RPC12/RpoP
MYVCTKCEEDVDMDPVNEKIICPYCSNRGVLKKRPETPNELKAR